MLERIRDEMTWDLGIAYDTPAACYHGGAFFEAVGDEFDSLEKLDAIITRMCWTPGFHRRRMWCKPSKSACHNFYARRRRPVARG